jgi:hypothetical protein
VPCGSFDACPAAARRLTCSTRARRLRVGSLVSLWCIVRRVPGGCPTTGSYRSGGPFDVSPVATRRLARIPSMCCSLHALWLPAAFRSLRRIVRRIPGCCPAARSYRFSASLAVCPFGLAACPASCPASCPAAAGSSLDSPEVCPATCLTAHLSVRFGGCSTVSIRWGCVHTPVSCRRVGRSPKLLALIGTDDKDWQVIGSLCNL